ncbi:MAG: cytochrome c oxidase subunit 3 family protein [Nitrospiraceae bacterium]|nr:MAG: cytochrome c oxidase subunit 3 family protein [Nitrospiraceae bacterium]
MEEILHKTAEHHRDYTGAKMGMWLFLFTEMLLFGGMFILYSVYRFEFIAEFHAAAKELDTTIGAVNTLILLTSSLTMALSIAALQKGNKNLSLFFQVVTMLLGIAFLGNKYLEWGTKIHHGIYPNSEYLLSLGKGQVMFYGLYFVMTGLHALHVLIGIVIFVFIFFFTLSGDVTSDNTVKLENSGLYWHLVDMIWVYLFPLFYLIT